MAGIERFEDLRVWQASREMVNEVYRLSNQKSFSKDFALVNQIRRSAISVMSNIAEGFESASDKKFANYANIAKSSAGECRSQVYIASDQNYISSSEKENLILRLSSISKQLSKLESYLRQENRNPNQLNDFDIPYEL